MVGSLSGKRVLVVEDEYYIAAEIRETLDQQGAIVIGPAGSLAAGVALAAGPLDAALLDVNLHGQPSFPIAEQLGERGIPCMLLTGYDAWALPQGYQSLPRLTKPFAMTKVVEAVERMVAWT